MSAIDPDLIGPPDGSPAQSVVLQMEDIRKRFGRAYALKGVDFDVREGETHALLGENGSGKSTLMKIAYGEMRATEGRVLLGQREVTFANPHQALDSGITLVPQEVPVVPSLSVGENILLGHLPRRSGRVHWSRVHREAASLLEELEAPIDSRRLVEDISAADRQLVAIARALSVEARLVIFDEPTSSLTAERTQALFRIIERLKSRGLGIVFISQRLQDIKPVADRITVLRDGHVIGTISAADADEASITEMVVGRSLDNYFHRDVDHKVHEAITARPVLRVQNLSVSGLVHDVSLEARAGEVLGVAGLVGCGRVELVRALFGAEQSTAGRVEVDGRVLRRLTPRAAIRAGIALLTSDRRHEGLVMRRSVQDNLTLVENRRLALTPLRATKQGSMAQDLIDALDIRPSRGHVEVSTLSGGNQQKVALGKWLLRPPRVLLLDEPTRGVDVGAKSEMYRIIRELAANGTAVVISSSENSELLGICDRLLMMFRGRIVAEGNAAELDEWKVAGYVAGA